jgi:hypothetical protein
MTGPDQPGRLPALRAGVTTHGLRYPGGADPLFDVPAYLQNLAEDITAKVQQVGNIPGRVFAAWTGTITTSTAAKYAAVPLSTIRWVRGAIVTQQIWSGGVIQRPALLLLSPSWSTRDPSEQAYWNKLYVATLDPKKLVGAAGQLYPDWLYGKTGLSVLAWGDPNP